MAQQAKKVTKPAKPKIDITKKEPLNKEVKKEVSAKPTKTEKVETKNETKKVPKVSETTKTTGSKSRKLKEELKETQQKTMQLIKRYNVTAIAMIAIALFIFAFIISAQMNTVGNTNIISNGMREAELLTELQKSKEEYQTLKADYEESEKIVEEYKNSASTNDTLISSMQTELRSANVLAGLANVKGEGVIVTLENSDTIDDDSGLVHDTDITSVITELKAAGAEAINVNGQRIIATTAIRRVGPTIQINSVKVAAPFYIKAIGNSKYLESALNIKNGVVDSLKAYGIKVDIETNNNIVIEKYANALKLKYASEVE